MTEPQPGRASLDLGTPRDIGGLVRTGFNLYFQQFRTFLAIAVAVVVPVQLVVHGLGLGWLTGEYDPSPPVGETLVTLATSVLVIAPLLTAMSIYALLDVADGRKASARSSIERGLDVFAPLLLVIVLFAGGVALGLLAFILPGLYLAVRWGFSIQAAVIDGARGPEALSRSAAVVQGSFWRVAGILLAANFLAGGLSGLVGAPFLAAAAATDSAVFQLLGQVLGGVLFAPVAVLITTLLYFDQKLRKGV